MQVTQDALHGQGFTPSDMLAKLAAGCGVTLARLGGLAVASGLAIGTVAIGMAWFYTWGS